MKKFWQEFKEFAIQGNMIDMAVGIIIGGAFTTIISSLVDDIINPLLGIITGNIDFSNLFIALDGNQYNSLSAAEDAGANILKYGSFISNIINFVIMALVVFIMIKLIAKLSATVKPKEEEAPTTKICPFCKSEVAVDATRCPFCTSMLEIEEQKDTDTEAVTEKQEEVNITE